MDSQLSFYMGTAPLDYIVRLVHYEDRRSRGPAILLVDKNLKDLLPLADACAILEEGVSVWTGSAAELAGEAALQDGFLGV